MASSKLLLFSGLFLVVALLVSSEVSAVTDVADSTSVDSSKVGEEVNHGAIEGSEYKPDQYGGYYRPRCGPYGRCWRPPPRYCRCCGYPRCRCCYGAAAKAEVDAHNELKN